MAQAVSAVLKGSDGLLESLLEILADAHDLAHGPHLSSQLILHALELFKGPSGKFDNHVIAVGHIFVQASVLAAGDLAQGKASGQHGGYKCDGEARSL